MGFFDEMPPPPPTEGPEEYRPPEWMAAPETVVGGFADMEAVLVRGPEVAVTADGFIAYTTGVEFHTAARLPVLRRIEGHLRRVPGFPPERRRHFRWART
ncbi:MAG TPA: hypothetical protein VGV93_07445 [Acidimicrobiales bacterium]|nr:hypothetical protein [Acidimicrobiales bacterium]